MKILGLGVPELLIILGVALLIFGPKHLPKLGSALGKTIKNLRDGISGGMDNVEAAEADEQPKKKKKAAAAKKLEAAKAETESAAEETPVVTAEVEEAVATA